MVTKYKKKWLVREKPRTVLRYHRSFPFRNVTTTETIENTPYVVSLTEDDTWMCSCPHWKARTYSCPDI